MDKNTTCAQCAYAVDGLVRARQQVVECRVATMMNDPRAFYEASTPSCCNFRPRTTTTRKEKEK